MSNSLLTETMLILSGLICLTQIVNLCTSSDGIEQISNANIQIICISSIGIVTALLGHWLIEEINSDKINPGKSSMRFTISALLYISFAITGIMLSSVFLMKNYVDSAQPRPSTELLSSSNGQEIMFSTVVNTCHLTLFVLAVLNFLFSDFLLNYDSDEKDQRSLQFTV